MLYGELQLCPTACINVCSAQESQYMQLRLVTPLGAKDEAYLYREFSAKIARV